MKKAAAAVFATCALLFASHASAQTRAVELEQALTNPELLIFSDVLRPRAGEVRMADGAIEPEDVLLSIPVAHRRTAVVEQNVGEGLGILVSPRILSQGARGYWSGHFAQSAAFQGEGAWCFIDEREQRRRSVCFLPRRAGQAPASWSANQYLASSLTISQDLDDFWDAPFVSERPVQIHEDLRLEFVFGGWSGRALNLEIRIGGSRYVERQIPVAANGAAMLPTPVGTMLVRRPEGRARGALVEWAPIQGSTVHTRRMLSFPDPEHRPIPVVRAMAAVTADAEFRGVAPGTEIFTQSVAPANATGVERRPLIVDQEAPDGAGPFAPYVLNGHTLACAMTPRVDYGNVSTVRINGRRVGTFWEFCLEDADGDHVFEGVRGSGGIHGSKIGMLTVNNAMPLDQPLAILPREASWPAETLRLYYVAGDDERHTSRGLRPTVAVFRLAVGDVTRLQPDWWILPVTLDAEGCGVLRLGGRVVAQVCDVALDGAARVRVVEGLAPEAATLLDPADFVR